MNEQQLDHTIDIKQYLRVIWRRRGIVFVSTLTALCAAFIALEFMPKVYESQVTLMIANWQPLARDMDVVTGGMQRSIARYGMQEERMANLAGRIRSHPFLERVVRTLRMHEDPRVREQAASATAKQPGASVDAMAVRILVQSLASRIRFGTSGSGIYNVMVADYSPQNAQLVAKWISELFVDVSVQNALEHLRVTREFGAEQLRIYEEQLRRSEAALEGRRVETIGEYLSSTILREDNLPVAEHLYSRVSDEATAARLRVIPFLADLAQFDLGEEIDPNLDDPTFKGLIYDLSTALQEELDEALIGAQGNVETWPPIGGRYAAVRREVLQRVKERVGDQHPALTPASRDAVVRFTFASIDREVHAELASYLGGAVWRFKQRAQAGPRSTTETQHLESEVETNRGLLQSFKAQLVASDVSQAMEATKLGLLQIEILDPARLPLKPSRPNRPKVLLAALFLGPLIGVGLAFAGEMMDPTLRTLDDFRRVVPEPILGTAPLLTKLVRRPGRLRRHWVPATAAAVVALTLIFFVAREAVVSRLVAESQPVQAVDPVSPQ